MERLNKAFTKERYDQIVKRAEVMGIKIISKWRKGLKNIKVAPIIISERRKHYDLH